MRRGREGGRGGGEEEENRTKQKKRKESKVETDLAAARPGGGLLVFAVLVGRVPRAKLPVLVLVRAGITIALLQDIEKSDSVSTAVGEVVFS